MKEKINEIWEELRVTIRKLRNDLQELVAKDMDLDSEGGIVQAIELSRRMMNFARDIHGSLESLFWVNKLRRSEHEEKD